MIHEWRKRYNSFGWTHGMEMGNMQKNCWKKAMAMLTTFLEAVIWEMSLFCRSLDLRKIMSEELPILTKVLN